MTLPILRPTSSFRRSVSSRAAASRATGPRTRAASSPTTASPKSRVTRSSWRLAPTGSRTSRRPRAPTMPRRPPMRTPRNEDLALAESEPHVPEWTCVLTRRKGSRDELIRLALGPDGTVAPDVRSRAAGRGAWIGVSRDELDAANSKGRLKPALQRAFKTDALRVPADLGELTEAALRQTALDRLGMEARAGNLINGTEKVEAAARSGRVHLILHAADAGDDGRRRLD